MKRRRGLKDHAKTLAVRRNGFHVIVQFLVFAAMPLIPGRVLEQVAMKLLEVIFRKLNFPPVFDDRIQPIGVAGHFLLVARRKTCDLQI